MIFGGSQFFSIHTTKYIDFSNTQTTVRLTYLPCKTKVNETVESIAT